MRAMSFGGIDGVAVPLGGERGLLQDLSGRVGDVVLKQHRDASVEDVAGLVEVGSVENILCGEADIADLLLGQGKGEVQPLDQRPGD